jgi:hypothetical protein
LQNEIWEVVVLPESLRVSGRSLGSLEWISLSEGQVPWGTVADLNAEQACVQWRIPEVDVTVIFALEEGALEVNFETGTPGRLTWPVVGGDRRVRGFVLPIGEGHYVPADDEAWQARLARRSPMDTMEGLSMPFWGVDCGDLTVTYILTNPFGNSMRFDGEGGRLGMRLSHAFRKNWKEKVYGVRIQLGEASPVAPAKIYRAWVEARGEFVGLKEKIEKLPQVERLLGAAHVYLWGDGFSLKMLEQLAVSGLDRLWLGLDSWSEARRHPEVLESANTLGYLIGPYDSYNSIHHPDQVDTWETAQFDLDLYERGGIVREDGKRRGGFNRKGYLLSPIAARPYVESRVAGLMKDLAYNSWFVDCDAFGQVYDDFSEEHPATQADDMGERLDRMAWIRDTYGLVVGSEGGVWYSAPEIHFAHGMTTGVIGWSDPDLRKNKQSPYYLGRYWPPDGPERFVKQVKLKPVYERVHYDPRFRLPLYQTVFHDAIVATHHWLSGSLKFSDQIETLALTEALYNVPPLYHLNLAEFVKHKERIVRHYTFFSPLHQELGASQMTDFEWLSADRLVQRSEFDYRVSIVSNFGKQEFVFRGDVVPGRSVLIVRKNKKKEIYSP